MGAVATRGPLCLPEKNYGRRYRLKREWRHEVSETWLRTRKLYLTASDIKKLVAEAKRIEYGKVELSESKIFAKLYGEKQSSEIDVESYGAMARGHILEPYAIEEYNKIAGCHGSDEIHWWDDAIICRGRIGFSPDGLDIPKLSGTRVICDGSMLHYKTAKQVGPRKIVEVKCYDGGNHFQRKLIGKNNLDERWQIACAMHVCPTIMEGILMFYAPQCCDMFRRGWYRSGLESEIKMVEVIERMWTMFCVIMDDRHSLTPIYTEDDIYNRYLLDEMGK